MRVQVRMCARDQIQASARVYSRVDLRERAHIWAYALHMYARLFSAVLRGFLLLGGVLVLLRGFDSLGVLLGWLVCLQWWGVVLWFSCGVVCGRDLFPPSYVRGAGGGSVCTYGGGCVLRVCTYACAYTWACPDVPSCSCTNAQTCARVRLYACPPVRADAFGCARAGAHIIYYPHQKHFSAIFTDQES